MNEELRKLIEQRAALHKENVELLQKAKAENRDLSAEEQETYDRRDAEFDAITAKIKAEEKREDQAAEIQRASDLLLESEGRAVAAGAQSSNLYEERSLPSDPTERDRVIQDRDNDELRRYLMGGLPNLTPEQNQEQQIRRMRAVGAGNFMDLNAMRSANPEMRALTTTVDASGGYLVPEQWFARVIVAMKAFGGMRRSRASVLRTSTGEQMHLPTVDDTGNTGNQLDENTEMNETDVVVGEKVLDAYLAVSDLARVPIQLLQDAGYDVGGLLARLLGERLGRKTNAWHTVGTGSNQPQGAVGASALGKTAASATAIAYLEMLDLKFSVDPAYWDAGQGEWMMNSVSTFKAAKKLLDGDSRPIFQPDVQSGRVDRIDGDPFILNTDMADIAASAKVMLYGDFSYFYIRDVLDAQLVRLNERFAEFLQVGFFSYLRTDSELADAGQNPIKHYIMAAS